MIYIHTKEREKTQKYNSREVGLFSMKFCSDMFTGTDCAELISLNCAFSLVDMNFKVIEKCKLNFAL